MKIKFLSGKWIPNFSIPFSYIEIFNKVFRGDKVIKTLGIATLSILILIGVAGAAPFAYVTG